MQVALTILAALAAVNASPIDTRQTLTRRFTVAQVESNKTNFAAPALAMANAIKKFGGLPPAHVERAVAASQSGTVTAVSYYNDAEYLSPVTIGGKTLNLGFDTGSSDLWVFSTLQAQSEQNGHDVYNVNSGVKKEGQTWGIGYGDGSGASGVVYADKVTVGSVTATSQAVQAATSISSSFLSDTHRDGLLGLGFSAINTVRPNQQVTFFDSIKDTLARKLFTVTLKKGAAGSFDFGFIDTKKYKGALTWLKVNTANGYWQFNTGGYSIGSQAKVSSPYTAIADTGTSLMLLPDNIVSAYYAKVAGASFDDSYGGYTFPCSSFLPAFTAWMGGKGFVVPGSHINYAEGANNRCFGGIQSNSGIGIAIFGDIFLKSQFVVFSMERANPQLGFATQA